MTGERMRNVFCLGAFLNRSGRLLFAGCFLVLAGCAYNHDSRQSLQSAEITREELLSGGILFGREAEAIELPDDRVLELTPEMRAFLDLHIPKGIKEYSRIRTLMFALVGPGGLAMEYNPEATYTAREAFRRSEGNCLGFSFLVTAMARERGIKTVFQEVDIPPEWAEESENIMYASRHVNVRASTNTPFDVIVDINRINVKSYYPVHVLSDREAAAHYYSNIGAEYLEKADMKNAFRYFVKAVKLSPDSSELWSNLGVFYRQNNAYKYAEQAYFLSLKYKASNYSAMTNLALLYDHQGEVEKADYFRKQARSYQMKNPYYRYYMARDAYEEGKYDEALDYLRSIIGKKVEEPRFYRLMADTYAALGEEDKAAEILEQNPLYR
jgi:Flp pilus assembly protein TadD